MPNDESKPPKKVKVKIGKNFEALLVKSEKDGTTTYELSSLTWKKMTLSGFILAFLFWVLQYFISSEDKLSIFIDFILKVFGK